MTTKNIKVANDGLALTHNMMNDVEIKLNLLLLGNIERANSNTAGGHGRKGRDRDGQATDSDKELHSY
jgi:hypothetical protein